MKKLIFIAFTLFLFSCSLHESEGRKQFREQGENFQLSSLGTLNTCFLTTDSISQTHTEFIDSKLSILETQGYDYYFVSDESNYTIACEKLNLPSLTTHFIDRYQNDKDTFWKWADQIATQSIVLAEGR